MANRIVIKKRKAAFDIESRRLAILEQLAQDDITVRESWKLLDELERSRPNFMNFGSFSTNSIPPQELERLVMDKIAICNDREKYKQSSYLTED